MSSSSSSSSLSSSSWSSSSSSCSRQVPEYLTYENFYEFKPIKKMSYKTWTTNLTKSQKKTFKTLIKYATKEIKKLDIDVFIVPLPISSKGVYWIDYPWDVIRDKYEDRANFDNSFIIIVLKIDEFNRLELFDNELNIQHNIHSKKYKKLDKFMKSTFKSKYKWDRLSEETINLKL